MNIQVLGCNGNMARFGRGLMSRRLSFRPQTNRGASNWNRTSIPALREFSTADRFRGAIMGRALVRLLQRQSAGSTTYMCVSNCQSLQSTSCPDVSLWQLFTPWIICVMFCHLKYSTAALRYLSGLVIIQYFPDARLCSVFFLNHVMLSIVRVTMSTKYQPTVTLIRGRA